MDDSWDTSNKEPSQPGGPLDDSLADQGEGRVCHLESVLERKKSNVTDVEIQDICFMKENAEGDEADIVVYVKLSGVWYEAIRERIDVNWRHYSSEQDLLLFKQFGFLMKFPMEKMSKVRERDKKRGN